MQARIIPLLLASPPLLLVLALQVMEPSAAQMSAAVLTLISTLIARESNPHGLLRLIKETSFARWGLEGYVISESNRLTGGLPALAALPCAFLHCTALHLPLLCALCGRVQSKSFFAVAVNFEQLPVALGRLCARLSQPCCFLWCRRVAAGAMRRPAGSWL